MPNFPDILRKVVDFILPQRCASCGKITPSDGVFCSTCWQKVHFIGPPWCASCAAPLSVETEEAQICANCLDKPPIHDGIRAAVAYSNVTSHVALRLKYGGKIGLAKMIAMQLKRHLPQTKEGWIVAPVPLHRTRLWARSFNQSALIGSAMAHDNDLEFIPDLLVRTKRTPPLRGMSPQERKRTLSKAFAPNPKTLARLLGAHIMLVDDVYTTGATTDACIKILKQNGAANVQIFCWACVLRGEILPEELLVPLDA